MSTKTLKDESKKLHGVTTTTSSKNLMISQKCLGIVLKRLNGSSNNNVGCGGDLVSLSEGGGGSDDDWMFESGFLIFQDFQEVNRQCYWNPQLVDSVSNVEYMGYVAPGTLLITANEYYLETLRSAWARRVLKCPPKFIVKRLGDVTGLEMQVIPQTQFTPLPEALCLVISELNSGMETASLDIIFTHLQDRFSDMIVPNQEIVYVSLGKLIKDRKVYHTGEGYFIVTPETYHVTTISPLPERPLLLTNAEAIHRLHGGELMSPIRPTQTRTRSIQTNIDDLALCTGGSSPLMERNHSMSRLERSGSLRLSRKEKHKCKAEEGSFVRSESMRLAPEKSKSLIKDINLKSSVAHQDVEKGEKVSVFSKLFRRSSSKRRSKSSKSPAKYATFSAQFPPLEWSDPGIIHYHSRSTQTLDGRSTSTSRLPQGSAAALNDGDHQSLRPLSVAGSSVITNATTATMTSTLNNNNNNNHSLNNNNNCVSSPTSMKSKTDSLSQLRETHERSSHSSHHLLRVRSSTLDSVHSEKAPSDLSQTLPPSAPAASKQERSSVMSPGLSSSKSSGLPRKIHSHSCTVLQESPSPKRLASHNPSRKGQSLSFKSSQPIHISTPIKSSHYSYKQHPKLDGHRGSSPGRDTKIFNIDQRQQTTDANRMTETKVKNTDLRSDEEYKFSEVCGSDLAARQSGKHLNRWSVHGGESANVALSSTMNNATSLKRAPLPGNNRQSAIKCINKLHGGLSDRTSPSSPKHSSNVTAAVRPTQAIRPLNQTVTAHKTSPTTNPATVANEASLTPSPSFSKVSFELESSAFKSITAQKLLKGASINSIDTLVEVNMIAEKNEEAFMQNANGKASSAVGKRPSTSSNGQAVSVRGQFFNNSSVAGGQSKAQQTKTRMVGEAHKMTNVSEADEKSESPVDNNDLKKSKPSNGSESRTNVTEIL